MPNSLVQLTAQQAQFFQLACFGALARELRHESNNLLAVAGAWANYRSSSDLASLAPLLDKSADAVARLTALERALGLCAMHKNGLQYDDSLGDILTSVRTILAPRLRVAGIELVTQVASGRIAGPTGPWVLALTLILRHALEEVAASGGRELSLSSQVMKTGLELTVTGTGVTSGMTSFSFKDLPSDGPEFWSGPGLAVARRTIEEYRGHFAFDVESRRYTAVLPGLP